MLVALILLFMTLIEYVGRRRDLGGSYLSPGLKRALKAPLIRRKTTERDGAMNILHFAAASNIFSKAVLTSLVAGGLLAGVPLMFTALGESISERAGVLNLGLEGMMLLGAYIGFIGAYYVHSAALGFVAGMAGGAIGSVVMVVLCVWLGLDQIVVGIAITLAGEGLTSVLQGAQFGTSYPRLGAPATARSPARQDPGARPEPLQPAAPGVHRVRVRGRVGLGLPQDQHRAEPARGGREARGARRRRGQRDRHPQLGGDEHRRARRPRRGLPVDRRRGRVHARS